MKLLFGKHIGKSITEVDSSYLVFIIESEWADWTLVNAAKQELSSRLKIDWQPPAPQLAPLRAELARIEEVNVHLLNVIGFVHICKGNHYVIEKYMNNPKLLESDLQSIASLYE
jgi:hypothetical protein